MEKLSSRTIGGGGATKNELGSICPAYNDGAFGGGGTTHTPGGGGGTKPRLIRFDFFRGLEIFSGTAASAAPADFNCAGFALSTSLATGASATSDSDELSAFLTLASSASLSETGLTIA